MSGLLSQAIIGAGGAPRLPAIDFVIGFFLFGAHFARRKQFQPHVRFLLFFNRCGSAHTPDSRIMTTAAGGMG